jgi:alcohol dehydrogenase
MIQKEYIYTGAIESVEEIIAGLNVKNIFLVRGNQSYIKSGAKKALSSIFKIYNVVEFSEFSVNPKLNEAEIGFDLFKNNNIDLIIAIGGGSVIDTAKIIKYLAIQKDSVSTEIPFIAVPTTAGTGSEATHFTVVYIDGIKHSWADDGLIPNFAIVDSDLLSGQSKYQMAVSGIDAFAQGVESFWSVNSTMESLVYSKKAIKLIWENLANAVNKDKEALIKIAEGSNWAGKAINISKTTAPHALSYQITKEFNLAHGHAVALFLPFFITYNFYLNHKDYYYNKKNERLLIQLSNMLGIEDDSSIVEKVKKFITDLCIETDFLKLGISKHELIRTFELANPERLENNPRKFNIDEFIKESSILETFL